MTSKIVLQSNGGILRSAAAPYQVRHFREKIGNQQRLHGVLRPTDLMMIQMKIVAKDSTYSAPEESIHLLLDQHHRQYIPCCQRKQKEPTDGLYPSDPKIDASLPDSLLTKRLA
mmetsp:Transcript_20526/g.30407  ORF Transcript_20526/g.30407 Transcript_20526/m.30407 type:complete len:114 (+) Transcript_20526:74-415(+)